MSNLILCFWEIHKIFICVGVRKVAYLRTEKSCLSEAVSYLVSTLQMCERKAYTKQAGSNVFDLLNKVSNLDNDQFMQVSL